MALFTPQPVIDPWVVDRSRDLLERAYLLFDNADGITDQPERFRQLYLAALRSSGAVLALYEPRVRPVRGRTSRNAWSRLAAVVPEFAATAAAFAERSRVRMDIESGILRSVDVREVEELRGRVVDLLGRVERQVIAYEQGKLPHQSVGVPHTA